MMLSLFEGESIKMQSNQNSNIWMFHRVNTSKSSIHDIYRQRGMVHTLDEIFCLIESALSNNYIFGSIAESITNKKIIHLTFDDGYKEHLFVAKELKRKYNLSHNSITFSINIRNSFYKDKLCMDIIYQLIESNSLHKIDKLLDINTDNHSLQEIKKLLFSTTKHIEEINKHVNMEGYFLNKEEIVSLSKLFSIASHGINHCYLTSLDESDIYWELKESKEYLSALLNTSVDTICFPEGNHSTLINHIAKEVGYKFGLAIASKIKKSKEYNLLRRIPRCD